MNPGDSNIRWLKLYQNNDWVWVPVRLRKTDINYINKYWGACEDKSAPALEKICARQGNAVACLCVQKRGGIPAIPKKREVMEFLNQHIKK